MSVQPTDLAHELDAAWIIALWLAIHGGAAMPEVVAARAIAALAQHVNEPGHQAFAFEELQRQFGKLGVTVTERAKHEAPSAKPRLQIMDDGEAREFCIHQFCFKFEGSTTCTKLPILTHLRAAA
jgi:hypothetical protein